MNTFEQVKEAISYKIDGDITPDMVLADHLDSLDMFDVMYECEDKYGIKIPTNDIQSLKTVQDVVDLIERLK